MESTDEKFKKFNNKKALFSYFLSGDFHFCMRKPRAGTKYLFVNQGGPQVDIVSLLLYVNLYTYLHIWVHGRTLDDSDVL